MSERFASGSPREFDDSWAERPEALYSHWVRGDVTNQIQFAFRQHWSLFREILEEPRPGRCLEVGCGRGSISAYFADAGYDSTLLDISLPALSQAKRIFRHNDLKGSFTCGDALGLPFHDATFDVVVSIGLLEHFEDIYKVLSEQVRVLAPGGTLLAYIVPSMPDNIQRRWRWLNHTLKVGYQFFQWLRKRGEPVSRKQPIYRSDAMSEPYVEVLSNLPVREIRSTGAYPLPMISYSVEFPFTVLPRPLELIIVGAFSAAMNWRRRRVGGHAWSCREGYGQALLVWCRRSPEGDALIARRQM